MSIYLTVKHCKLFIYARGRKEVASFKVELIDINRFYILPVTAPLCHTQENVHK